MLPIVQATTSAVKAKATLLMVAMGVTVVTTTVTMPTEETTTVATTVATVVKPQATMAMVAMGAALTVVSLYLNSPNSVNQQHWCCPRGVDNQVFMSVHSLEDVDLASHVARQQLHCQLKYSAICTTTSSKLYGLAGNKKG